MHLQLANLLIKNNSNLDLLYGKMKELTNPDDMLLVFIDLSEAEGMLYGTFNTFLLGIPYRKFSWFLVLIVFNFKSSMKYLSKTDSLFLVLMFRFNMKTSAVEVHCMFSNSYD